MLPKLICSHPYFHNDIDEKQAREILHAQPEGQGNYLFCKGNAENEFLFVYKSIVNDKLTINTSNFYYSNKLLGSKWSGTENIFSGLHDIVNMIPGFLKLKSLIRRISIDFSPKPIFNSATRNQLTLLPHNNVISGLPNDVVGIIFKNLDINSFSSAALVSKSWRAMFNKNLLVIIEKRDKEEAERIKKRQDEVEGTTSSIWKKARTWGNTLLE